MLKKLFALFLALALAQVAPAVSTNATFILGTYNVENWNYIERDKKPNQPKPPAAKEAVVNVIVAVQPDVLGIQEMGNTNDFAELRQMLRARGQDYPYWEHVQGPDKDRHVCLISKFPIVSRQSRTDYTYDVNGWLSRMGRGVLDVTIRVNDQYWFRAVVVHLKSKRQADNAPDQALVRLEEAKLVRAHLGKILKHDPYANLIALGDFNDTPDSLPYKTIVGDPPFALFPLPGKTARGFDGTHFWRGRREWSRIDHLLVSPGMSNESIAGSATIREGKDDAEASDHRLLYAKFHASDIGPPPTAEIAAAPIAPPPAVPATPAVTSPDYRRLITVIVVIVVLLAAMAFLRRRTPGR
jgi:endonuclease/exonuclease/phosphatase family metal-dependent hydrolase